MKRDLAYMRRRLKAAKSRALYWSGNPSFTGRRFQPNKRCQTDAEMEYEIALTDVDGWLDRIEEATGKRPKWEPPRAKVVRAMAEIWNALSGTHVRTSG